LITITKYRVTMPKKKTKKIKSTLDCDIKILNRLFSNQQVDV